MLKYENIGLHGSVWKASFCIEFLGLRETQQGVHFRWLDDDTRRFVGGCFCFHVFALHFSPSAFLSWRKEASGSGLNPFGGKRNASAGIFFSVWKRNFVVVLGVGDTSAIDPWRNLTSEIDQKRDRKFQTMLRHHSGNCNRTLRRIQLELKDYLQSNSRAI